MVALARALALALLAAASGSAYAAPRLDPIFTENAVVQRDRPVLIAGTATPSERLAVRFAGQARQALADRNGRWSVRLPPMGAGGPHRLEVRGAGGGTASVTNLLVGDVWLCAGQSNMEFPVGRSLNGEAEAQSASDEQIRIITIPQKTSLTPRRSFEEAPSWQVLTPGTAAEFSAACYFMALDLRAREKVPLGLIDASWGGTRIRAWMDEEAARAASWPEEVELLALHRSDPLAAARRFAHVWGRWWRERTGDAEEQEPWRQSDRVAWTAVPRIGPWDEWEGTGFADFNGGVWARRRFTLTAEEAAQPAILSLGVIDDLDQTFVNGIGVGSTFGWSAKRDYTLTADLLRPGTNEVLIYIGDSWGYGGFQGPAEQLKLTLADGSVKPLGSGWEYSIIPSEIGNPPRAPWDTHAGIGVIYNAMVAPLGPLGVKGVAWYQGESDVGIPGYDARLAAMMASWRRQFRDPQLPFLVVGLAGLGQPTSAPSASAWAELQDEQRKAAARDPRAALVPALDIGERGDIHPPNKQEVGRRLALAARARVYGDPDGKVAPLPVVVRRTPAGIQIDFMRPLRTFSGARPIGFELCAETQATCRYAEAHVAGNSVVLANEGRPATRVRYAWSDYPVVNLYSEDLPVPTFELLIS